MIYGITKLMDGPYDQTIADEIWNEGKTTYPAPVVDNPYLKPINIPPYDSGNPEHVLINESNGNWNSTVLNDPTKKVFYIEPGEYTTNIELTQRGVFAHGGLLIGYVFTPTKPIHLGFSARIGGGGITLIDDYSSSYYDPNYKYKYDDYPYAAPLLILSPQVDLEMNLTNWFKFRISAGYQYVNDASVKVKVMDGGKIVEKEVFNASSYSTPTFSMGFVFGWFK